MYVTPAIRTDHALPRFAALAIAAAVATMALKFAGYALTGSVGLLSDAIESSAKLLTAIVALFAVWYAARPADRTHNYGHEKVEFFAAGIEGALVLVAAVSVAWISASRLFTPHELEGLTAGLVVSVVASAVNLAVGRHLIAVGRRTHSIALAADGRHLITDVVTSAGVVIGLILVGITGRDWLDPALGLLVALNIVWTGISLLRISVHGLMDRALPVAEELAVRDAITAALLPGETYHALRTRESGSRRFADFHLLVPGAMSVHGAHEAARRVEHAVEAAIPQLEVTIHVEPIEDPAAWGDSVIAEVEAAERLTPPPPAGAGRR